VSRWLPYAVLAAVIALLTRLNPTNDAAWQLWIGRQLANGAVLYGDVVEVNPPLWFWLAVPIVEISNALGISGWAGLLGFFGLSAALSIALVQRLNPGLAISLALVFAFFLTGLSATGQREQFTLIAVMPYIFLTATRAEGRRVPLWLAIAIGAWAAFGLALKHYFVLVPLALELWLVSRRRAHLRPEFLTICGAGAAYVATILVLTPEYLRSMVPLIGEAYYVYNKPLAKLLLLDPVLISALALVAIALVRSRSQLVQALAIAGLAFLVAFLLQLKGFRYQGLPAIGVFSTMAIVALIELDWSSTRAKLVGVLLALVPVAALATTNHGALLQRPERDLVCSQAPGSKVLVLTPYGDFAWPGVEACGLQWTSRYMFLWMLPAIENDPRSPLVGQVRTAIVKDIARYRPDVIIIQKDSPNGDSLAFVLADPRFRSELRSYALHSSTPTLVEFRRRGPGAAAAAEQ
jgi:hypothetical protein